MESNHLSLPFGLWRIVEKTLYVRLLPFSCIHFQGYRNWQISTSEFVGERVALVQIQGPDATSTIIAGSTMTIREILLSRNEMDGSIIWIVMHTGRRLTSNHNGMTRRRKLSSPLPAPEIASILDLWRYSASSFGFLAEFFC